MVVENGDGDVSLQTGKGMKSLFDTFDFFVDCSLGREVIAGHCVALRQSYALTSYCNGLVEGGKTYYVNDFPSSIYFASITYRFVNLDHIVEENSL